MSMQEGERDRTHESQLVGLESLAPFASLGSLGLFTKGIVQEFFTSTQVFVGR